MIAIPRQAFYFIRHGETEWNKNHMLMGSKDIPLNEHGKAQAEDAAYIMKDVEFSIIYSSPLTRAMQTANIIAELCLTDVIKIDGFKEKGMGEAEGKVKGGANNIGFLNEMQQPKGAELIDDFRKRVLFSLSEILSKEQYPVIVSHGGVFKVIASSLSNITNISIGNGEIFCFSPSVFDLNKWDLIKIGN